ncbi:UNVERIFIED_CONTAM: putative aryl-alcohol dehydrogenase [Sesamum radiatum]|uniref:Aryl-alcohol dehydrogenase n=1 Tax=Sesamum radiatum TaxID=300843 RepID=A0AAW2W3U5_SESRA
MAVTAMSVNQFIPHFYSSRTCGGLRWSKKPSRRVVRCCEIAVEVAEKRKTVVKNGNDSLEICRVLNGMWQTSGGWGRIDRDDAIEAMLRYADAGLSTFDMADHWTANNSSNFFTLSSIKRSAKYNSRVIEKSKMVTRPFVCLLTDDKQRVVVKNGKDSLDICRVVNGMWQTSGGWGRIDRDNAVEAMLRYADAGLNTFDLADIYGPAEDLYGIFINRVRRERPPEYLENVRGLTKWVPPPVKMTSSFVRENINVSRKRMDVASLDMLQFHWFMFSVKEKMGMWYLPSIINIKRGQIYTSSSLCLSFVLDNQVDYSNPGYLDALKHLTDLKEEGKIKTVALTNFDTERLQKILENGIPVVSNQVQHSIVDMRPQQKMAELCHLTGVKLITYGTVMGGLLSEKFLDTNLTIPFAGPPLNTPSLQKYKRMVDAWGGWNLFQVLLQTLKRVASKHGVSISTVAVRYILDQQAVAGSMVGVRLGLAEHIKDTNAIFSLVLDEEDVSSISEVSQKGKDLMKIIGDCGDEYRRV